MLMVVKLRDWIASYIPEKGGFDNVLLFFNNCDLQSWNNSW